MAFNLRLDYKERNDNKALLFYDVSAYGEEGTVYTQGGVVPGNRVYQILLDGGHNTFSSNGSDTDAIGSRFIPPAPFTLGVGDSCMEVTPLPGEIETAELDIQYTTADGNTTSVYTIDLVAEFGPFDPTTEQNDLVYTIDMSYLGATDQDFIPDGIYDITYRVTYLPFNNAAGNTTLFIPEELNTYMFVYGLVKVGVYDKLRKIPIAYMCNSNETVPAIEEAELASAYLSGIEASAYTAKKEELLRMLSTLQKLLLLGTNLY